MMVHCTRIMGDSEILGAMLPEVMMEATGKTELIVSLPSHK